jgi:hypothetical protein
MPSQGPHSFPIVYDIQEAKFNAIYNLLAPYEVDFSDGISLPDREAFVNSTTCSEKSIIHNKEINNAHHDIIIPAMKDGKREDMAVQAKASFGLDDAAEMGAQNCISKTIDARVPLLLWLYLDSTDKERRHDTESVVFLNASGCCNGLTLEKLKHLIIRKGGSF